MPASHCSDLGLIPGQSWDCGGQHGIGAYLSLEFFRYPLPVIIPQMLHIISHHPWGATSQHIITTSVLSCNFASDRYLSGLRIKNLTSVLLDQKLLSYLHRAWSKISRLNLCKFRYCTSRDGRLSTFKVGSFSAFTLILPLLYLWNRVFRYSLHCSMSKECCMGPIHLCLSVCLLHFS